MTRPTAGTGFKKVGHKTRRGSGRRRANAHGGHRTIGATFDPLTRASRKRVKLVKIKVQERTCDEEGIA